MYLFARTCRHTTHIHMHTHAHTHTPRIQTCISGKAIQVSEWLPEFTEGLENGMFVDPGAQIQLQNHLSRIYLFIMIISWLLEFDSLETACSWIQVSLSVHPCIYVLICVAVTWQYLTKICASLHACSDLCVHICVSLHAYPHMCGSDVAVPHKEADGRDSVFVRAR